MAAVMRLGSLCTGYGGLDLGAELALGPLEHAWHAEIDPDASRVLAAHWPDVPNLGDLTAVDWTRVEPVEVLTAGYPCQPLSLAGQRRGMEDERWIWDDIARAIRVLRPRLVVLENVAGHLSLGFGRVLGDLAAAGFDAEWGCVRASDVGAAHRCERVFIVAWPAADPRFGHRDTGTAGVRGVPAAAVAGGAGAGGLSLLPTPAARDWRSGASNIMDRNARPLNEVAVNLLPTPRASDTGTPGRHGDGGLDLRTAVALLPTPRATDGVKGGPNQRGSSGDLMLPSAVMPDRWGDYAPAIARWERVTGRPAPDPTEPGTKGQPRLSPRFVEWLMGLPAGWVTDHLPRNPALRVLGNGVVPQQSAHAIRELVSA